MNSACSFFMNMKKPLSDSGSKINENFKLKKKRKRIKRIKKIFFLNQILVLGFNKYAREFSKDFIIMKNNYKDSDKKLS